MSKVSTQNLSAIIKMNKLCIICPSVLDLEVYKKHIISLENLFFNKNTEFEYILHLDEHIRPGVDPCTAEDYEQLIEYINVKYKNVKAKIIKSKPRIGLTLAMESLFNEFLNSDSQQCVVIEDDSEIISKIYVDEFFDFLSDENYGYRLSFGAGHRSSENPFIVNDFLTTSNHSIYENTKNSCHQNGSFFSRKLALNFKSGMSGEPENFIKQSPAYSYKKIRTIFTGHNLLYDPSWINFKGTMKERWVLPKSSHILYDGVRFLRRTGWSS